MKALVLFATGVTWIATCAIGCVIPTYDVTRAALVPHSTVPFNNGQALDARALLTAGASNIGDVSAPVATDDTAAVQIPSTQLRGELKLRAGENGFVGVAYEHGFVNGSTMAAADQPRVTLGDVTGYGVNAGYSFDTTIEGLRLGVSAELMLWNAPYAQGETCNSNCDSQYRSVTQDFDTVHTFGAGITPSYRTGRFTIFGGLYGRNQPTITGHTTSWSTNASADVQPGPIGVEANLGLDFALGGGFSIMGMVHQNLTANPVSYGPNFAVAISIPFAHD